VKIGRLDPEIICLKEFVILNEGYTPTILLNSGVTRPTFSKFINSADW